MFNVWLALDTAQNLRRAGLQRYEKHNGASYRARAES